MKSSQEKYYQILFKYYFEFRDREAVGSSLTGVTALLSLSKTHLSYLSTGSTQEDPSLFNWKIVDGT